jgi:hypothetical protein
MRSASGLAGLSRSSRSWKQKLIASSLKQRILGDHDALLLVRQVERGEHRRAAIAPRQRKHRFRGPMQLHLAAQQGRLFATPVQETRSASSPAP